MLKKYQELAEEFEPGDRIYCSQPACSAFIPKQWQVKLLNSAICPSCLEETCMLCKQTMHQGDCREDLALRRAKRLAKDQGWQTCTNCSRIVERSFGCNHITYEP